MEYDKNRSTCEFFIAYYSFRFKFSGFIKVSQRFLASLINNSCTVVCINLSTPVGDQDRICPFYIILYNIMQTSDENKEKYQL